MSSRSILANVIFVACGVAGVAVIIAALTMPTGQQQGTNAASFSTAALKGRVLEPSQEVLNLPPTPWKQSTAVRFPEPVLHLLVLPRPRLAIGFR